MSRPKRIERRKKEPLVVETGGSPLPIAEVIKADIPVIQEPNGSVLKGAISTGPAFYEFTRLNVLDGDIYCCGEVFKFKGDSFTCPRCKTGWVLEVKKLKKVREKSPINLLPTGVEYLLQEDYREKLTSRNFLLPKNSKVITVEDFLVLPVDRAKEVLAAFKPMRAEWGEGDIPLLTVPIPFDKLKAVNA